MLLKNTFQAFIVFAIGLSKENLKLTVEYKTYSSVANEDFLYMKEFNSSC